MSAPLPALLLAPFFPPSLTLVPLSLLRNLTETPRKLRDVCPMESQIKGVKKGRGQLKVSSLQRSSSYRGVRSFWRVFVFATTYMKAVNIDICLRHHARNQPHNKLNEPGPYHNGTIVRNCMCLLLTWNQSNKNAEQFICYQSLTSFLLLKLMSAKKRLFP